MRQNYSVKSKQKIVKTWVSIVYYWNSLMIFSTIYFAVHATIFNFPI